VRGVKRWQRRTRSNEGGGGEKVPAACSRRKKRGRKEAAAMARWPFYRGTAGHRGGGSCR
jgi:hypothetical protein